MNKKFILRIFACVFVVVIGIGCFSGCGMDLLELLNKHSSSQESTNAQASTDKEYFQSIVKHEKSQRIVNCVDVVNNGKHNDTIKISYYDDGGNYYYLYYLGRIEDFIIHNYYSFQYTADRQILKNFSVTISQATTEQVKTSYTNTVNRSVNSTISSTISSSVTAELGVTDAKISSTIEAACTETWAQTLTETHSESFEKMTNESNSMVKSFQLDYQMCQENYYYCYATCADVDLYVAIVYHPGSGKAEYNYFTSMASLIREKVFVSNKDDFLSFSGQFSGTFLSKQFDLSDKPSKYISNFPRITESFTAEQNEYKVKKANAFNYFFPWKDTTSRKKIHVALTTDNGDGRTTMQKYAELGYNAVQIKISFYYYTDINAQMRMYIAPIESNEWYYKYDKSGEKGKKNYSVDVALKDFLDRGDIWLNFENENVASDYTISMIHIDVTYYLK